MKELKNTADFTKLPESSDSPVVVTKNGCDAFVALSTSAYEALEIDAARLRLYQSIDRAEADIAAGRTVEATSPSTISVLVMAYNVHIAAEARAGQEPIVDYLMNDLRN